MERPSFLVSVNGTDETPRELTAVITHQDMLRGEQIVNSAEGGSRGSLLLTTAWCYAALVRQGDYTGPWERFRDIDCDGIDKGSDVTVPPTIPAAPSV